MKPPIPSFAAALSLFALAVLPLPAQVPSRPPLPEIRIEDVELHGGVTYRSLVFQAALGMEYVVQSSEDLVTWQNLPERHYGLNHEVVVPMIEKPEPGNPPQGPPPGPPPAPMKSATLILHRADGGGVILSFRSLDGGQPLRHHLEELSMSAEWDSMPLYVNRFDNRMFCILHSGSEMEPDEENPPLGPEDEAMIEDFEEHFAAMDAEVVANVIRTRTLPDPPAQAPGQKLFLRLAILEIDTDADGTPDWLEFAQAGNENPGEPPADPWNWDADGNGIPDGQERDSDNDGVPDALDAAPANKLIDWEKSEHLVFAWFPVANDIDGPVAPMQVNDQGVVLFSKAIWRNGDTLPLLPGTGGEGGVWGAMPLGLGDNGAILGRGMVGDDHRLVTWPANGGQPIALQAGGDDLEPARPPVGEPPINSGAIPPSDMVVNKDGVFIGMKLHEDEFYRWKLEAGQAQVSGEGQVPAGTAWVTDDGALWGMDGEARLKKNDEVFERYYDRVTLLPHERPVVFAGYKQGDGPFANQEPIVRIPRVFDESWQELHAFEDAVDFSTLAGFAINRKNQVWHNGKQWKIGDLSPDLPDEWRDGPDLRLTDTTRRGWTLLLRKEGGPIRTMLGTPLRLSADVPGKGLDDHSIAASDDEVKYSVDLRAGNKDEYWIMVPAGGSTTVRVKSAANAVTPIRIDQTGPVTTDPTELTSPNQFLVLSAQASVAEQEIALPLKIDSVSAASAPVRVKIMKPRVVNVSVWPLKRPNFTETNPPRNPPPFPSKQEIEEYLNGLYQPQLNVTFNVTIKNASTMALNPGNTFYVTNPPNQTQRDLAAGKTEGDIQIFIAGSYVALHRPNGQPVAGMASIAENWAWLHIGTLLSEEEETWLNTMAHEIGHIFFGAGHPNDEAIPGPAFLPETDVAIRLMRAGDMNPGPPKTARRLIVKTEWDRAERWLNDNIEDEEDE